MTAFFGVLENLAQSAFILSVIPLLILGGRAQRITFCVTYGSLAAWGISSLFTAEHWFFVTWSVVVTITGLWATRYNLRRLTASPTP